MSVCVCVRIYVSETRSLLILSLWILGPKSPTMCVVVVEDVVAFGEGYSG